MILDKSVRFAQVVSACLCYRKVLLLFAYIAYKPTQVHKWFCGHETIGSGLGSPEIPLDPFQTLSGTFEILSGGV